MCKSPEILLKKQKFLERYNPTRSVENAMSSSFDATLQRNKLYDFDTSVGRKKEIKTFCSSEMLRISAKYINDISVGQYEADILELQSSMMANLANSLM